MTLMRKPGELPPRRVVNRDFSAHGLPKGDRNPMNVIAHVHTYPPTHNNGANHTLHQLLLKGRAFREWRVQVFTDHLPARNDSFESIPVRRERDTRLLSMDYQRAEVCITHLNMTRKAIELSQRRSCATVHLIHNPDQIGHYRIKGNESALMIFNSDWLAEAVPWEGRKLVMHPLVEVDRYKVDETGDAVTLVNLSANKGARLFYQLAEQFPDTRFLGVQGGYGDVVEAPAISNLEIVPNTADIREVMRQTRLLLMPSQKESWGRTAIEAACSGIPSVCSTTSGPLEAGVAAGYIEPDDFENWCHAVDMLTTDETLWAEEGQRAYERARELNVQALRETVAAVEAIEALR